MQRIGCAMTPTAWSGGTCVAAIWTSVTLSTLLSVAATHAQTATARVREDGVRLGCSKGRNDEGDRVVGKQASQAGLVFSVR